MRTLKRFITPGMSISKPWLKVPSLAGTASTKTSRPVAEAISAAASLVCALVFFSSAHASVQLLPGTLVKEALSESVPTAFAPAPFEAEDFSLEWFGEELQDVRFSLGRNSLEWVRVSSVLVIPRARLLLRAENAEAGQVHNGGFSQPLSYHVDHVSGEVPVALLSGEENLIHVSLVRGGRELKGRLQVKFKPRHDSSQSKVYIDPSCSPFRVSAESSGARQDEWAYIGCRLVHVEGVEHRTSSLEMYVYWDNVGQRVKISGIDTDSSIPSVWPLRLRSEPGLVELKAGEHRMLVRYSIADKLSLGFLGVGVGPYQYTFSEPFSYTNSAAPVLTLYGSYFLSESMRLVAFNLTALHSRYFTDFGLYLNNESFKTLDNRLSVNLMLGAHVLGFRANGKNHFNFGGPQGLEIILRDAFLRRHNLALGGFVYPEISGNAYYNVWLRWGTTGFFGEFNYIAWRERLEEGAHIYSRALGFSFGFPLARFF